jgi:hypothetical protein
MKITSGIIWERKDGAWVQTLDNWPLYRRGAKIQANNDDPFGDGAYNKHEAVMLVTNWIETGKLTEKYYRIAVLPGKGASSEVKEKLQQINAKKKEQSGLVPEPVPVESYISEE